MIEIDSEIYKRTNEIGLTIPKSVCIIGVGGVGGWLAFKFPLLGIDSITLVDPDVLEESNLNRLPYKYDQIGMKKVNAMEELIRERRMCDVAAYPMKWEELPQSTRETLTAERGGSIIIDCRDTITPLNDAGETYITGGYDGSGVTIHTFPNLNNVWGDGEVRYRITPSYLVPPDFISMLIINFICYEMWADESLLEEKVVTFDVKNLFKILKLGVVEYDKQNEVVSPKSSPRKLSNKKRRSTTTMENLTNDS